MLSRPKKGEHCDRHPRFFAGLRLDCGNDHQLCVGCIRRWLDEGNDGKLCPMCRQKIPNGGCDIGELKKLNEKLQADKTMTKMDPAMPLPTELTTELFRFLVNPVKMPPKLLVVSRIIHFRFLENALDNGWNTDSWIFWNGGRLVAINETPEMSHVVARHPFGCSRGCAHRKLRRQHVDCCKVKMDRFVGRFEQIWISYFDRQVLNFLCNVQPLLSLPDQILFVDHENSDANCTVLSALLPLLGPISALHIAPTEFNHLCQFPIFQTQLLNIRLIEFPKVHSSNLRDFFLVELLDWMDGPKRADGQPKVLLIGSSHQPAFEEFARSVQTRFLSSRHQAPWICRFYVGWTCRPDELAIPSIDNKKTGETLRFVLAPSGNQLLFILRIVKEAAEEERWMGEVGKVNLREERRLVGIEGCVAEPADVEEIVSIVEKCGKKRQRRKTEWKYEEPDEDEGSDRKKMNKSF